MEEEYIPTAESWLETLAKLIAHQNGEAVVTDFAITKKENKGKEPA